MMNTLNKYRELLRKKGLYTCFFEAWNRVWKLRYCRNLSVVKLNEEYRVYQYLRRNYKHTLLQLSHEQNIIPNNPYPDKIWVLWLQGVDNAPTLVKRCIQSQQQFAGDKEVIVLTSENLNQYITLPEHIQHKHKLGRISFTHLSDIIRVTILAAYGGLWLDSTCLLTDTLPEYISHPKTLFLFQSPFSKYKPTRMSSWLMSAVPHNPIIEDVRDMLYLYWKKENNLRHYYLVHLFFTLAVNEKEANSIMWNQMPFVNNSNPHMLQERLFMPYDAEWLKLCKSFSAVHKLTYKFDANKVNISNTFYEHLIK